MADQKTQLSREIRALAGIEELLDGLQDDDAALRRTLSWIFSKYGRLEADKAWKSPLIATLRQGPSHAEVGDPLLVEDTPDGGKEIAGIAKIGPDRKLQVTARDLKASSTNDAAIRLVHVICFAHARMTGEHQVSSKSVVLPQLRAWRAYTANTRVAIARHKGIQRNGDWLSLDKPSELDAEKYIQQILDPELKGTWAASAIPRRRSKPGANGAPSEANSVSETS